MMIISLFRKFTVVLLLSLSGACSTVPQAPERSLSFDTRIYIGDVPLDVVVFDTPRERELGLMYVDDLPEGTGALFVFDEEELVKFWMKNTRFSMDMLFFDQKGVLKHIVKSVAPCNSSVCPGVEVDNVKYVLEIKTKNDGKGGFRRGDRMLVS